MQYSRAFILVWTSFGSVECISILLLANSRKIRYEYSMKTYSVYIVTNSTNDVLYTGVTRNLKKRLFEHKHKVIKGYSAKYNLNKLVYSMDTESVLAAIKQEKLIKSNNREWQDNLITENNPDWKDLALSNT